MKCYPDLKGHKVSKVMLPNAFFPSIRSQYPQKDALA
jgi:hypothetical protein